MNNQNEANGNGEKFSAHSGLDGLKPLNSRAGEESATKQLEQFEKEMSSFEKSTLRWSRTAVIMSSLAAIFVCLQWWEMHTSGADTHNLATAGANQTVWTQHLAESAGTQAEQTKGLAESMKKQADLTKTLADQATIQATEATIAANAAKSAAQTAARELEFSKRPWISGEVSLTGPLVFDANGAHVDFSVKLKNAGHSPAIHVYPQISMVALQSPMDIAERQKKIGCDRTRPFPAPQDLGGVTLFPYEDVPPNYYRGSLSQSEIEAGLLKHAAPGYRGLELHLVGCIVYEPSIPNGKLYATGISFVLGEPFQATEVGKYISLNTLRLTPEAFHIGSYAR